MIIHIFRLITIGLLLSCSETNETSQAVIPMPTDPGNGGGDESNPDTGSTNTNRVVITDRTGKNWDITYAVKQYGFIAEGFQFGIGPFAITPIVNPEMISRGEEGYPSSSSTMQIIGTRINGEARAYPLKVLNSHEIVDESFGNVRVAVGY